MASIVCGPVSEDINPNNNSVGMSMPEMIHQFHMTTRINQQMKGKFRENNIN
jgi:hypothetical protein